jgi:hypothetical protein
VRFSLRSKQAPLKSFSWGTIMDFSNPANRKAIRFIADGDSREYGVEFHAAGYLARLEFDFGEAEGVADFDWIGFARSRPGAARCSISGGFKVRTGSGQTLHDDRR